MQIKHKETKNKFNNCPTTQTHIPRYVKSCSGGFYLFISHLATAEYDTAPYDVIQCPVSHSK